MMAPVLAAMMAAALVTVMAPRLAAMMAALQFRSEEHTSELQSPQWFPC